MSGQPYPGARTTSRSEHRQNRQVATLRDMRPQGALVSHRAISKKWPVLLPDLDRIEALALRVRTAVDKRCARDGCHNGVKLVAFATSASPLRLATSKARIRESWGT